MFSAASATAPALIFTMGGKLNFRIEESTSITARLGVGYETLDTQVKATSAFVGGGGAAPSFIALGGEPGDMIITTGVGLNLMENEDLNISINYDATIREDYDDQSIGAKIRYKW